MNERTNERMEKGTNEDEAYIRCVLCVCVKRPHFGHKTAKSKSNERNVAALVGTTETCVQHYALFSWSPFFAVLSVWQK